MGSKQIAQSKKIAIVGMSGIFPGAPNVASFWDNICAGKSAISTMPTDWGDANFFSGDLGAIDSIYCRQGGFIDDFSDFDPLRYGVVPKHVASIEPEQLLSLRVGIEALEDAGYSHELLMQKGRSRGADALPRATTGVIIGRGNYLSSGVLNLQQQIRMSRQVTRALSELLPDLDSADIQRVKDHINKQVVAHSADTAGGLIPNLVASRLANKLDFRGPAYTVDAACASALVALEQSCRLLQNRSCDLMVTGGVHLTRDLTFWATFCQLGAMSRQGACLPFSKSADGLLAGEAIGLVVLKRFEDAQRDGDRIYAVIDSIGTGGDGASGGLLAPSEVGQVDVLKRTWESSSLEKEQLGLLEAHGTATPVGDKTELSSLRTFFGEPTDEQAPIGLGSVKSMIGHTMPASGIASLIKTALAVYHGKKPVTLAQGEQHPLLAETRFALQSQTETWQAEPAARVAAVNAFGFGGINAHLILQGEESLPAFGASTFGQGKTNSVSRAIHRSTNVAATPERFQLFSAQTQDALLEKLEMGDASVDQDANFKLAIINPTDKKIKVAKKVVQMNKPWHGKSDIYFSSNERLKDKKLAFIFPGVDNSFNPRFNDVCDYFNLPLPPYCQQFSPTNNIVEVSMGLTNLNKTLFNLLGDFDVKPDAIAGHSIGEWGALAAVGCVPQAVVDDLSERVVPVDVELADVLFLAVACSLETLRPFIEKQEKIHLSHDNCPHQVIVCGEPEAILSLEAHLKQDKIFCQVLPIISGFHSPFFEHIAEPFEDFFHQVEMSKPRIPLWSAHTGKVFPTQVSDFPDVIIRGLHGTVRFRELVENFYADDFHGFVQVGFGSLSGFIGDTLKGRPHVTIAANTDKRSGMAQLIRTLSALWVEGKAVNFEPLLPLMLAAQTVAELDQSAPKALQASPSKTQVRLALDVPLLSFRDCGPLRTSAVKPLAESSQPRDGVDQLFLQTLADIEAVSKEVAAFRQQRLQALTGQRPLSNTISPPRPGVYRDQIPLDINKNIQSVIDHSFYQQPEDWPVLIDRQPVIPLTMELNLIRRAVEKQAPGFKVIRLESVRALAWLYCDEPITVDVTMTFVDHEKVDVMLGDFMKARAIIALDYPKAQRHEHADLTNERPSKITAQQLYADNWMFHGPAYQGVSVLGPVGDNGINGQLSTPSGDGSLLDNMGQVAGYWVLEQEKDCLAMPIGIEFVEFYDEDPQVGTPFQCLSRLQTLDDLSCISNVFLYDAEGHLKVYMKGWHIRRYQMDRRLWMHSKKIESHLLSHDLGHGIVVFEDQYKTMMTRDYISKRYMGDKELTAYNAVHPKLKRQWLNSTVAIKDAIRSQRWLGQNKQRDWFPKELVVTAPKDATQHQFVVKSHQASKTQIEQCVACGHSGRLTAAMVGDGASVAVAESNNADGLQALKDAELAALCTQALGDGVEIASEELRELKQMGELRLNGVRLVLKNFQQFWVVGKTYHD